MIDDKKTEFIFEGDGPAEALDPPSAPGWEADEPRAQKRPPGEQTRRTD